jgi:hypothetical protein
MSFQLGNWLSPQISRQYRATSLSEGDEIAFSNAA